MLTTKNQGQNARENEKVKKMGTEESQSTGSNRNNEQRDGHSSDTGKHQQHGNMQKPQK